MLNPLRVFPAARLLLLLALLLPAAASLSAQTTAADTAKVISLMQAANYPYKTTRSPTVWVVHFTGTNLKDIKLIIAVGEGPDTNLVIFVTVTEKRRMPVNTDFMRFLLEQNHKVDRIKIAYDADGDLEVRSDSKLRLADVQEFTDIVSQVKNVSNELYGMIQPQLQP